MEKVMSNNVGSRCSNKRKNVVFFTFGVEPESIQTLQLTLFARSSPAFVQPPFWGSRNIFQEETVSINLLETGFFRKRLLAPKQVRCNCLHINVRHKTIAMSQVVLVKIK